MKEYVFKIAGQFNLCKTNFVAYNVVYEKTSTLYMVLKTV